MSNADKASLVKQGPLDRSHLTYLMQVDPQLRELVYNKSNVAVFVTTLEYSFGLLHRSAEQVVEIHDQVTNFLSVQTHPAVLVVFLGVVNHWVAIVAKRPNMSKLTTKQRIKHENGLSLTKIYLMDSSNMTHLDKKVIDLPSVVMQRV